MQELTYAAGSGGELKLWRGIAAQITVTGVDSPAGTWSFLADNDLIDGAILIGTAAVSGTSIVVSISSTNTTELAEAIQGKEGIRCRGYLTDGSRVIAIPLVVLNRAVSGTPTPVADYYTKAQVDALLAAISVDSSDSASASSARSVAWSDITGKPDIPDALADLSDDSTHRTVTDAEKAAWNGHIANVSNPHSVTAAQVGLGNVNNTADADKPVSTAMQTALDAKITNPSGGTTGQVLTKTASGDVAWQDAAGGAEIALAACSSLGFITGTNPRFGWTDPDNVVLNGSTLATWSQTVLVRKVGSYPASSSDGTVMATTSAALANKNYYRDHNFEDTTQETGVTYYYKLFSQTAAGTWNNLVGNQYTSGTGLSWNQVQQYVRAGRGAELFPVGTVFAVTHSDYGTLNFRVSGHDQVPCADETLTHSMCLEMVNALLSDQYDAPELQYAITADTVTLSGKTYYKYESGSYTALVAGTDYQIGDPVPVASWYEMNPDTVYNYGNGRYSQSNIRQWLNSSGTANNWFTKQNIWDQCSSTLLARNGFCYGIDSAFLSVVKQAQLLTAVWSGYGIAQETTNDKFWPLSQTQVFGSDTGGIHENDRLQYYVNGGSAVKTDMNGTAISWCTRSPHLYGPNLVIRVTTSGSSGFTGASDTIYISLACIIA